MPEKKLYAVYHMYEIDGGYGDAVPESDMVGLVYATHEEIEAFVKKYDNPEVYDHPYAYLHCHGVEVEEVEVAKSIDDIQPYGVNDYYDEAIREYKARKDI